MSLLTAMQSWSHSPTIHAYLDGQPINPVSANVDLGFDVVSSQAQVTLDAVPSWISSHGLRKTLEIWLGYDGFSIPVFKGWVEDDSRAYFPFDNLLSAGGPLKLTQYQYPSGVTYASQKDVAIKQDLLAKAGITNYSVEGENTTNLGTVQDVTLEAGQSTWDLINQLDQLFGYKTFDCPDGVVRSMRVSGVPGAGAAFAYVQGATSGSQLPIQSISRPQTLRGIHNKVVVTGLAQYPLTPGATRQAANPLVPSPPTYIAFDYRSDLVETNAVASAVALRLIGEVNGILEEITFEAPGNPYLSPGMTISITSGKIGLSSGKNFYVQHVTHSFDDGGFHDTIIATRIEGGAGYELGKAPIPVFTFRVTKEQYYVGGVPTTMYTVTCDGSASWDPDSPPDTLTFAWSNNKNADTGTAVTYSTSFTQAQMDNATKPTITLVVNDADPTSPAGTLTQTINASGDIAIRDLYVAADGRAEATKEGDINFNTWTPGAGTVISTPPIVTGDYGYWGLSNGQLRQSADHLTTAPTLIHTFATQINCIYINRIDPNRVTVGLSNGDVWVTVDANLGAASTWAQLYDGATAIMDLWEYDYQPGLYRFTMGKQWLITYDNFAHVVVQIEFADGDTARKIAASSFANYFCGTTAAGPAVKRDDGTPITFGDGTVDVHAIAHHIRDDVLYAARLAADGTTINTYSKLAGATAFTAKATVTLGGQPNSMVADPDNQLEFFLAANQGLYKTFDGFGSIVMVRDYTAAGINGSQVGIGALALPAAPGDINHVYSCGVNAAGGVFIAETFNYQAPDSASSWTAIGVGGLPAAGVDAAVLILDPFAFQAAGATKPGRSYKAWCRVQLTASTDRLYYSDSYLGSTTTWTLVLDINIFNTYFSLAVTVFEIAPTQVSISEDGLIVCAGTAGVNFAAHVWCLHSHDRGATWAGVKWSSAGSVGGISSGSLEVHQEDSTVIYLAYHLSASSAMRRSSDGGHTFGANIEPSSVGNTAQAVYCPYNTDPNVVYRSSYWGSYQLHKSMNGGGSWSAITTVPALLSGEVTMSHGRPHDVLSNWSPLQWFWAYTDKARLSSDEMATYTGVDMPSSFFGSGSHRLNPVNPTHFIVGGMRSDTGAITLYSSADWVTFTIKTGDINTVVGAGANLDSLVADAAS